MFMSIASFRSIHLSGIAALALSIAFPAFAQSSLVKPGPTPDTIQMQDGSGKLKIRLNYGGCCFIDSVEVNGKETIAASTGVCTGISVDGNWITTRGTVGKPVVKATADAVLIKDIAYAAGAVAVREDWLFSTRESGIDWRISRRYLTGGTVDDSYFPGWDFASIGTWTAAILDTGGVAWNRYLGSGASYGNHAASVDFWKGGDALRIRVAGSDSAQFASRFSCQPSGVMTFVQSVTRQPLQTKHQLHRSIGGMDVWKPYPVEPGTLETTLRIQAADADEMRSRGDLKGIDGKAVADVLDTIGRYGVVDRGIVGGNGWLTGWVCLHEPFFAQMGLALGDPNFTSNLGISLNEWRDHALQKDGRVYSRWHHDGGDNMRAGTYDPSTGYYDCGWGWLMDSQPDYVINVAEYFDLAGDITWLKGQKEPCERALDWILARDTDHDGLVEMMTESCKQRKSSDWLDVVWASWENAFVNAKLYHALALWSEREKILGDPAMAGKYRVAAEKLRESFVKPVNQGGFWNPDQGWFIYWRDKDDSLHGDNLVTPVNFAAVAYDLATPEQSKVVLRHAEAMMRNENLFHWPLCFLPFAPGEGRDETFPAYENGDIFLSWGELGIRSYAKHDPGTAVAYVNRVLDRYRHDGLSFQRYLRSNQHGAGDDILAGNSMTVAGLYRDIYGVRPQWDRMMLDPHLTPELEGTVLDYKLRGQSHRLTLGLAASTGEVMNFKVKAPGAFAYRASADRVAWFAGAADQACLEIARLPSSEVSVEILKWPATKTGPREWKELSAKTVLLSRKVSGLEVNARYQWKVDDQVAGTVVADSNGSVVLSFKADASTGRTFSLVPTP